VDGVGVRERVVAPVLAAVLARLPGADWRAPFLLTGVLAVGLAVATAVRLSGSPAATGPTDADGDDSPEAREYLRLFRNPRFSAFVLVTVGFSFAHNGLVAFLPLYLSEAADLATSTANLLYSLVFAVTFVQLVTGDLSDRVGRFPVMVAALGLAATALVALVSLPGLGLGAVAAAVVVAAFGLGSHGFQPVRSAYLMELLPERLAGGGLGVVRTLLMGAGALAPGAVGVIADAVGFRPAFALLAGSMGLAAVVAAGLWLTE
ncbi:MFS transporter, partial [Halorubrum sp. SP9]|uniref:MFS transporter n=1 Tax=Halorubrum sp. SP9 TaxID=1537267 RepID=UPI0010F8E5BE